MKILSIELKLKVFQFTGTLNKEVVVGQYRVSLFCLEVLSSLLSGLGLCVEGAKEWSSGEVYFY